MGFGFSFLGFGFSFLGFLFAVFDADFGFWVFWFWFLQCQNQAEIRQNSREFSVILRGFFAILRLKMP